MTSIELTAPAKVNLLLKVLNKRKDSYHDILTVFERISLADKIRLSKISEGIALTSNKPITPRPEENLAYKAAELVMKTERLKKGVKISIKKNIPIAGGLGGGSSDAATVLIGMNALFNLGLKEKGLLGLARKLGADVPFFILNAPFAVGTGRGDRLKTINSKVRFWHLLIYPGFGLSAKEIYEALDFASRNLSKRKVGFMRGFASRNLSKRKVGFMRGFALTRKSVGAKIRIPLGYLTDFNAVESMLYNDLEDIVKSKKIIIDRIIKRLASLLGKKAIVSGSGPSLFCLYRTRKEAVRGKKIFLKAVPARKKRFWQVFIVRTLS